MSTQTKIRMNNIGATTIAFSFTIVAFILGCIITASTIAASTITANEDQLKKIPNIPIFPASGIGLILSVVSFPFIKYVIEGAIENESKEKIEKIKEEYKRKAPESIKEQQELEFLAIWTSKEQLDHIDFNEMSQTLREELMKNRNEFKETYLENFKERYEARKHIIDKLSDKFLTKLVGTTVDGFLNKKKGEITEEENKKYKNFEAILKAWVICSIKFDREMPIESLHEILKEDELEILKYFKEKILTHENFKKELNNDEIKIIDYYISRLIDKIYIMHLSKYMSKSPQVD